MAAVQAVVFQAVKLLQQRPAWRRVPPESPALRQAAQVVQFPVPLIRLATSPVVLAVQSQVPQALLAEASVAQ